MVAPKVSASQGSSSSSSSSSRQKKRRESLGTKKGSRGAFTRKGGTESTGASSPRAPHKGGAGGGHRTSQSDHHYATYIHRIFKTVAPGAKITKRSMEVLNSFVEDILDRIAQEAGRLCQYGSSSRHDTLSNRDCFTAVKLTIPGELQVNCVEEGMRALAKYSALTNNLPPTPR